LYGEDSQSDAASCEVVDGVDEVVQVGARPIELPNDERVVLAKRLEAGGETGSVVAAAGGAVVVEVGRVEPAASSASCCSCTVWDPSAFETLMLPTSMDPPTRHVYVRLRDKPTAIALDWHECDRQLYLGRVRQR
jgi:hypothetical protein